MGTHNTYKDAIDPTTGHVVKTAAQVEADVEAGLIAKGIKLALAKRIVVEGGKPLADGNLFFFPPQRAAALPLSQARKC